MSNYCEVFIHDWSDSYHGGYTCNAPMPCARHPLGGKNESGRLVGQPQCKCPAGDSCEHREGARK